VRQIAGTAERISALNLEERLPSRQAGDEIDALVSTINGMLDRLQRSFEEIRKFSADASHELRTPLCAMRGEAEVLLSKERSASEYREAVERFMEQFDRLNRLTNDLLMLARFEGKPLPPNRTAVALGDVLKDLGEFFEVVAQDRGIELELALGAGAQVMGDSIMLQQAFSNLMDNAIKYTPRGGRVSMEMATCPQQATVRIRDTGVGIPQEDLPHVFERFYRVDKSRSRETGGSGLGLSIARKIVELHGGRIGIQSEPGQGTTVTVALPVFLGQKR
jgi:heavy metal sensor kinase